MYRNICYSPIDKTITLFTWNNLGERVRETYPFKPYFFIEDDNGKDGVSLYNTKLKKIECESSIKRKEIVKSFDRNFYNIQPEQQFLIERYLGLNKTEEFGKWNLKIYTLDIEVYSPNEFPDPKKANHPITLLSIHDSLTGIIYVFGLGNEFYPPDKPEYKTVIYKSFSDELSLLKAFLKFWRKDYPDVVTGWFVMGFDIPYICNRLIKLTGKQDAPNKLSPVDYTYKKTEVNQRAGNKYIYYDETWTISGVTTLDYQFIYQVFTQKNRESYSLNFISEVELGEGKVKYDAVSLSKLQLEDWNKFVEYNIQDVNLVVKLEKQLKYLETCKKIAHYGLSPLISAVSTVNVVTGLAAQEGLLKGKYIPTFNTKNIQDYEGGFVKEPKIGITKSILYFDANSLYPNTIITLNASPETKVGKILSRSETEVKLEINGKQYTLTPDKFNSFVKQHNLSISLYNILFSQKERGIFSNIVEYFYNKRVEVKTEMKAVSKKMETVDKSSNEYKKLEKKYSYLDNNQYVTKIFINRVYGYFGQEFSPMYDVDMAASITKTGQGCIKKAATIVEDYIKQKYDINYDIITYSDTDSILITIDPVLQKLNIPFLKDDKINKDVIIIANDINKQIDDGINSWARTDCNSIYPKYEFKRENISYAGLFLKKKHYILNIRDDEGKSVDDFKYKGVEVVRISTPKKVKPLIKNIVENIIKNYSHQETQKILNDVYEKYQKLELNDIATIISLNGYTKYLNMMGPNFAFNPRTPRHVRAAIYYNHFLKEHDIDNKYEKMKDGDKIKVFYVEKNPYNIQTFAYIGAFPEEFKTIFKVDIKKMFETSVYGALDRVFEAINWKMNNPLKEEKCDLLSEFS